MGRAESQHYHGAAGDQYHAGKRQIPAPADEWVARSRAAKLRPWVPPDCHVFELGAGYGWNLAFLECAAKTAWEPAEAVRARWAEWGIAFNRDWRSDLTGRIDRVVCHHVLEHVTDPLGDLASLRALLNPAGRLILHVPFERERRYRNFNPSEPNHHLFSWNPQTLGNLVLEAGFKIETLQLRRYGYDRFAARLALKMGLGGRGFAIMRNLLVALRPLLEVELVASLPPARR